MKSDRRVNTAATLQTVYLVWFFLRITTMCNLSIFGLVRGKFPESFAHAQTVTTRPLFPPNTWPGYEAKVLCELWSSYGTILAVVPCGLSVGVWFSTLGICFPLSLSQFMQTVLNM